MWIRVGTNSGKAFTFGGVKNIRIDESGDLFEIEFEREGRQDKLALRDRATIKFGREREKDEDMS